MERFTKLSIFTLLFIFLQTSFSFSQTQKGLIRVHKVQGIEVYFMSEPLREYEVVTNKNSGITIGASAITGGLVNEGISEKATKLVKRLLKSITKKGLKIDAVVYSSGKSATGIKFTSKANENNKGIGRVHKIMGIGVYILGDPVLEYDVIGTSGGGLKLKSLATGGLINNSIEEDVSKMVKKLKRKTKGNLEGILYSSGSNAVAIKLKGK